jgi:cytochrome c oxidase assembly factor CtaG
MSLNQFFHNWMSDGTIAWGGLALTVTVGALYLHAAARTSPRGARWPLSRTAAFLGGLALLVVALDSGVAAHDDVPWVHMLQHALLMMVAPMLFALGAPVTLALRTMRRDTRKRLVRVLHDPSIRLVMSHPGALVADYNLTMAVALLAPIYRLAERVLVVHIAIHIYLIMCGSLFWSAVLARDPVPSRLPGGQRVAAAAIGIPVNLALAAALLLAPVWFVDGSRSQAGTTAAVLVIAATATTLVGAGIVALPRRSRRARRPTRRPQAVSSPSLTTARARSTSEPMPTQARPVAGQHAS